MGKVIVGEEDKPPEEIQRQSTLTVFVGGGGSKSEFYRETIESTHTAFKQERANIPEYELRNIPFPKDLDMKGINPEHFHRFAIAYGLSIPKEEAPESDLKPEPSSKEARPKVAIKKFSYSDEHDSM